MISAAYKRKIFFILSFFLMNSSFSLDTHQKLWQTTAITKSFGARHQYLYYIEPQLQLINDPYVFNQFLLFAGLGYAFNPAVRFLLGPGITVNKNLEGKLFHERIFWQQLQVQAIDLPQFSLSSRTRLEERQNTSAPSLLFQARERLWIRIPFKNWAKHSFSTYNEIFLNLNHPKWASPYFFDQNRAFIGIGTQITPAMTLDVGYMNQFLHNKINRMNNVALISLTIVDSPTLDFAQ